MVFHGFGNVSIEDIIRRNSIAYCLEKWNMIDVIDKDEINDHSVRIFVLPHSEKQNWKLIKKFNVENLTNI